MKKQDLMARPYLIAGAILLLAVSHSAQARQSLQFLPPPVYSSNDSNGVDMATGRFNLSRPGVSIGAPGNGLAQVWIDLDLRDNFRGNVERRYLNAEPHSPLEYTVTVGASSAKFLGFPTAPFSLFGGQGPQTLGQSGSDLIYTDGDGTVYRLSQLPGLGLTDSWYITSVERPDGEKLTYTYVANTTARQSIVSNLGYMIHYDYVYVGSILRTQKITALNLAVDYCAPSAASCATTRSWPSLTFSTTSLFTFTDAIGRTTTVTPNTNSTGAILSPGGALSTISFGSSNANQGVNLGRVTSFSNGQATWNYSYTWVDATHEKITTTATDPLGHVQVLQAVLSVGAAYYHRDALNQIVTFELETGGARGRINAIVAPEGGRTQYSWDARGNLTAVAQVAKPGSGQPNIVAQASFDATCANAKTCNKPNYTLDALGARTDYTYDANHGGVLTITGPAGQNGVRPQTRFAYAALYPWYKDASGQVVQGPTPIYRQTGQSVCATTDACAGTADEIKTTVVYGAPGVANNLLPTSVTTAAGDGSLSATTTTAYDEVGNVILIDGPLPGPVDVTRRYYDAMRQTTGVIAPDPDGAGARLFPATRTTYNLDGRPTLVETGTATSQADGAMASFSALRQELTAYDVLGRRTKASASAGGVIQAVTQYAYDAEDRQTCSTVRMNTATFESPPASACELAAEGLDGPDRMTYVAYDALDRVTQVTNGYGVAGAQIERTVTYTADGNENTIADGKGNLTTYEYDGFNRLTKVRYPNLAGGGSSNDDYDLYGYDANGARVSWRRRDGGHLNFYYDALGRLYYRDGIKGWYYYDNLGRSTWTYSGDQAERITVKTYDALGRTTVESAYLGTTFIPLQSTFDAAGRRTRLQWHDAVYVDYEYDYGGAMTAIRDASGAALVTYTYDDLGRRTALYRANGAQTHYGYDLASRLSSLTFDLPGTTQDQAFGLSYNPAGQLKTRTSSNGLYDWTLATASRSYTINGLNQATSSGDLPIGYDGRGNLNSDGATTFAYDLDNHLVTSSAGAALAYDPVARLSELSKPGSQTTRFAYDGANLVSEFDANNTVIRRYVPGPGADEPMLWYEGSGSADRRWLLGDAQASIVAVTDSAGTATINRYDEYGIPASTNVGRYQYTGQTWLGELGLYNYKARIYSPTLGRFLQTDPTGYDDGLNWYTYVGNDPMNRSDPTGTAGCGGESTSEREKLGQTDCENYKDKQEQAKRDVAAVKAGLDAYRANPKSAKGVEFANAMTNAFGKGALSAANLSKLDGALGKLSAFYNDPGTAKGGKYDVYKASAAWKTGGTILGGQVAFGPDYFKLKTGNPMGRINTIHEPMHLPGFNVGHDMEMMINKTYYRVVTPYWDKIYAAQSPTGAQRNIDNWACMISGQCK